MNKLLVCSLIPPDNWTSVCSCLLAHIFARHLQNHKSDHCNKLPLDAWKAHQCDFNFTKTSLLLFWSGGLLPQGLSPSWDPTNFNSNYSTLVTFQFLNCFQYPVVLIFMICPRDTVLAFDSDPDLMILTRSVVDHSSSLGLLQKSILRLSNSTNREFSRRNSYYGLW